MSSRSEQNSERREVSEDKPVQSGGRAHPAELALALRHERLLMLLNLALNKGRTVVEHDRQGKAASSRFRPESTNGFDRSAVSPP